MDNKKGFLKGALTGALAMLVITAVIGAGVIVINHIDLGNMKKSGSDQVVGQYTEKKLEELKGLIDEIYLHEEEVDEEALTEGIYQGYIAALNDPYSAYYTAEETKEMMESTSGEYSGIGALMSQNRETGVITIANVYENSPAAEAGMKNEDILYKVEGEEVTGVDLSEVVTRVKGEEGTEVKMTLLRGADRQEIEITAVRRKLQTQTVSYEMKEGQIGYIRVSEFDEVTLEQFREAKAALESQGMASMLIDLRGNPGGNLSTVCDMLREILPEGLIVYTEERDGERTEYKCDGKTPWEKPLAVLINGASASASEIFAGAVQDYGIGQLVGTTTYGKGVVQQLFPMTDGTMVKLTIAEYFTPKGRNIDGTGIVPDVEIEYVYDETNPEADNQMEKALELLRGQVQQ
ncbi:S41 family peptidase [Coprococcus sp. AF21-14LB]|uniref:S41 family peptidase n=1 Tax=Coprococcus sp. AF21-14LB TaxID=2292231 RepID=UPI000E4E26E4|nr:S41 family peptidase [Coprococcus sp. AF21-14LB]RGS82615.1 S41 family peptidase [Coprococcus sp. AF21-14LB]